MISRLVSAVLSAVMVTSAGVVSVGDHNPLEGKSIAFVGDSISYGENYLGGYGKIIGESNSMTVTNRSACGATLAENVVCENSETGYRGCIGDYFTFDAEAADYIVVEGGINDFWMGVEIGDLTEGFEYTFDESTFTGGLERIFYTIRNDYPKSKAGFVIIHNPFCEYEEEALAPYYERIKETCDKWSVPYLDLYSQNNQQTGVDVKDVGMKKTYFGVESNPGGDGCHPNELGYRTMYVTQMTEWLKSW